MNSAKLRSQRNTLYAKTVRSVAGALAPFMGSTVDDALIRLMVRATKRLVDESRKLAQTLAYRDYLEVIQNVDPIPRLELNRFTDELWTASIARATKDFVTVAESVVTDIAMSADYWSRDAEWGQRVDAAKNDARVGRVARVDFEPPSCPFCTLLNSRGPVYISETTAARTLHTGDQCELVFVPRGTENDYPGRDSVKQAEARYIKAVKAAGPQAGTNAILQALKDQEPDRAPGRVRTLATRSAGESKARRMAELDRAITRLRGTRTTTNRADTLRNARIDEFEKILASLEGTP